MPRYWKQLNDNGNYRDVDGNRYYVLEQRYKETSGFGLATVKFDGVSELRTEPILEYDCEDAYAAAQGLTPCATGGGGGGTDDQTAAEVPYDNSGSTLLSTDVNGALDELDADLDNVAAAIPPKPTVAELPAGTYTFDNGVDPVQSWTIAPGSAPATVVEAPSGTYTFDNGTDSPVAWTIPTGGGGATAISFQASYLNLGTVDGAQTQPYKNWDQTLHNFVFGAGTGVNINTTFAATGLFFETVPFDEFGSGNPFPTPGHVPAAEGSAAAGTDYLAADGTWKTIPAGGGGGAFTLDGQKNSTSVGTGLVEAGDTLKINGYGKVDVSFNDLVAGPEINIGVNDYTGVGQDGTPNGFNTDGGTIHTEAEAPYQFYNGAGFWSPNTAPYHRSVGGVFHKAGTMLWEQFDGMLMMVNQDFTTSVNDFNADILAGKLVFIDGGRPPVSEMTYDYFRDRRTVADHYFNSPTHSGTINYDFLNVPENLGYDGNGNLITQRIDRFHGFGAPFASFDVTLPNGWILNGTTATFGAVPYTMTGIGVFGKMDLVMYTDLANGVSTIRTMSAVL